jgi:hypothetical protein
MSAEKKPTAPVAKAGGTPAACTTEKCPLEDQIVLVELVEVFLEAGKEKTQPPNGRDQFINLDEKVEPATAHPEYGRSIQLKARVEWKAGDKNRSLTGKNVYWYIVPDAANRTGLTGAEKEGFAAAGGSAKNASTTDDKGWTPPVKFFLSLYGGDKFDVFVTEDPAYKGGKKAGSYIVWRKFWYHITEMKDGKGGKFDVSATITSAFEAGYKTAFMKFTEKTPRTEAVYVSYLANSTERATEDRKYFTADDLSPFKCHIMTVDYSETATQNKTVEDDAPTTTYTTANWEVLWKQGGGTHPWKVSAKCKPAGGSWADIPDGKFTLDILAGRPGFKKIKIDLGYITPAPTAAAPARIKLEIKVAGPGVALGWGGGSYHLYLCTGALRDIIVAADRDPTQKSDAVHEIGHALGLVNMPPAPAHAHDAWEDTAHASHCNKLPTECAMFWQSSTTRLTTFHFDSAGKTGCHDYLRRQDFSRSVMKDRWKD